MKNKLQLFSVLVLIVLSMSLTNKLLSNKNNFRVSTDVETIIKNDWTEALLEFGDDDDTLDSLNYVPYFLR